MAEFGIKTAVFFAQNQGTLHSGDNSAMTIADQMREIALRAKKASRGMANMGSGEKDKALGAMADAIPPSISMRVMISPVGTCRSSGFVSV